MIEDKTYFQLKTYINVVEKSKETVPILLKQRKIHARRFVTLIGFCLSQPKSITTMTTIKHEGCLVSKKTNRTARK